MAGSHYFLLSFLPGLGDLGSAPPLSVGDLFETVKQSNGPADLMKTLLLGDDLIQREAFLAGEITELELSVLSPEQGRGEAPLGDHLTGEAEGQGKLVVDRTWDAYFRYAVELAKKKGSEFISSWVRHEVTLRNALVEERARTLELQTEEYLVAEKLGDASSEFRELVRAWSEAETPLEGFEIVEKARWNWLVENDSWFSFKDDELLAYAAKLLALRRWERVCAEPVGNASAG